MRRLFSLSPSISPSVDVSILQYGYVHVAKSERSVLKATGKWNTFLLSRYNDIYHFFQFWEGDDFSSDAIVTNSVENFLNRCSVLSKYNHTPFSVRCSVSPEMINQKISQFLQFGMNEFISTYFFGYTVVIADEAWRTHQLDSSSISFLSCFLTKSIQCLSMKDVNK